MKYSLHVIQIKLLYYELVLHNQTHCTISRLVNVDWSMECSVVCDRKVRVRYGHEMIMQSTNESIEGLIETVYHHSIVVIINLLCKL